MILFKGTVFLVSFPWITLKFRKTIDFCTLILCLEILLGVFSKKKKKCNDSIKTIKWTEETLWKKHLIDKKIHKIIFKTWTIRKTKNKTWCDYVSLKYEWLQPWFKCCVPAGLVFELLMLNYWKFQRWKYALCGLTYISLKPSFTEATLVVRVFLTDLTK